MSDGPSYQFIIDNWNNDMEKVQELIADCKIDPDDWNLHEYFKTRNYFFDKIKKLVETME